MTRTPVGDGHCPECATWEEWCGVCEGFHFNDPCNICGTQRHSRSFGAHGCTECNPDGAKDQLQEAMGKSWLLVRSCLRAWPADQSIEEALSLVDANIASIPFLRPHPHDRLMLFLRELVSENGPHAAAIQLWIRTH